MTAGYPAGPKLGVDVGRVRVGLAGSDRDGLLATPVRTLSRDVKKNSDVRVLVQEARERGAVEVFVGLPKNLSGREAESAAMARDYAQLLADALEQAGLGVPVRLIDERLSTVSAHRSLREAGLSTREHRKVVDQVAAVEILQHAIDMQRSLGRDVGEQVSARLRRSSGSASMASSEEPVISESTLSGKDQEL
ncbi:Holliday junction resolvase RuvX [Arthrobacter sp. TMN-37]